MGAYILRRLLLMFPTLIGVTLVTFLVMICSPGGLRSVIVSHEGLMDPRQRAAVEKYYSKKYGLDKPLPVQYLLWLNKVSFVGLKDPGAGWPASWRFGFKPVDLGESIVHHRPVLDMVEEALPITLLLNGITFPIMMGISLWTGIKAAQHRGGLGDVVGGSVFLGLWSIPQVWAGVLLVGYLANRNFLHWFPASGLHDLRDEEMNFLPTFVNGFHRGWLLDTCWHLVLPVVCFMYAGFAFSSKLTRTATLENMAADFVRTARAKGVSERQVLYRHVLRNSLLPLITYSATIIPGLIGGAIIVESIFGIPGMGKLGVDAVFDKDKEMVLSTTLVATVLTLLSYLLGDIAYAIADPRVSFEAEAT
jgi:ABC-type dipeptide/oligopeptide/nickel transport system permease component